MSHSTRPKRAPSTSKPTLVRSGATVGFQCMDCGDVNEVGDIEIDGQCSKCSNKTSSRSSQNIPSPEKEESDQILKEHSAIFNVLPETCHEVLASMLRNMLKGIAPRPESHISDEVVECALAMLQENSHPHDESRLVKDCFASVVLYLDQTGKADRTKVLLSRSSFPSGSSERYPSEIVSCQLQALTMLQDRHETKPGPMADTMRSIVYNCLMATCSINGQTLGEALNSWPKALYLETLRRWGYNEDLSKN